MRHKKKRKKKNKVVNYKEEGLQALFKQWYYIPPYVIQVIYEDDTLIPTEYRVIQTRNIETHIELQDMLEAKRKTNGKVLTRTSDR